MIPFYSSACYLCTNTFFSEWLTCISSIKTREHNSCVCLYLTVLYVKTCLTFPAIKLVEPIERNNTVLTGFLFDSDEKGLSDFSCNQWSRFLFTCWDRLSTFLGVLCKAVPETKRLITSRGGHSFSIRWKTHCQDTVCMTCRKNKGGMKTPNQCLTMTRTVLQFYKEFLVKAIDSVTFVLYFTSATWVDNPYMWSFDTFQLGKLHVVSQFKPFLFSRCHGYLLGHEITSDFEKERKKKQEKHHMSYASDTVKSLCSLVNCEILQQKYHNCKWYVNMMALWYI